MKRIQWKNYAGFRKAGKKMIGKKNRNTHLRRASWLTAMVESGGKFGCVINFDGTGITAGIHQAIAVYPRQLRHPDKNIANDQGPLWKLLRLVYPFTDTESLWNSFERIGWHIGKDNRVRWIDTGKYVSGFEIREEFMGSKAGVVPVKGEGRIRAERWINEFYTVFSDPGTFDVQEEYGIEHFVKRADRARFRFCRQEAWKQMTMNDVFYREAPVEVETFWEEPQIDLALCMYWSHSVNAPGQALKLLCKSLPSFKSYERSGLSNNWPRKLIRILGTSSYGRWDDDIKNGRYQRTRRYAMKSGFWPEEFFKGPTAIMPKDL